LIFLFILSITQVILIYVLLLHSKAIATSALRARSLWVTIVNPAPLIAKHAMTQALAAAISASMDSILKIIRSQKVYFYPKLIGVDTFLHSCSIFCITFLTFVALFVAATDVNGV